MEVVQQDVAGLGGLLRAAAGHFTSIWLPIQLGLIAFAAIVSAVIGVTARRRLNLVDITMGWPAFARLLARSVVNNLGVIVFAILLAAANAAMVRLTVPSRAYLLGIATSLATAWVVIVLLASLIRNQFVNRIVAVSAWTIAALSIVGLLGPTTAALDSVGVVIGGLRFTPLLVLKLSALLLLALWIATATSNLVDRRLRGVSDLTPSLQVLIGKLVRLGLITFAVLTVLSSVGVDLSALALFSGAIGVGVGFGLQKIVSNFVSGIILLADKSIKPGDVISLGDSFGWISEMRARHTSVVTRDGREFLIPNEDFVTQRVVNWSYSNNLVRLDVDFGVGYGSDPHQVRRLAVGVLDQIPRVLKDPLPVCHLMRFGDSSLDFVLYFWIRDPVDGLTNIRGAVLLALWDIFKREGIEIPFPQRDVHVKGPLRVVTEPSPRAPD